MRGKVQPLSSRTQTGTEIYESARYFQDLGTHLDSSLRNFYDFVKNIPYKEDLLPTEIVSRPRFLLQRRYNLKGLDCKKKAVLMGAWLNAHNIPWRLIAVSERPDKAIHHVFVQAKIHNEWKNVDATYPEYHLFEKKPSVTYGEILLP